MATPEVRNRQSAAENGIPADRPAPPIAEQGTASGDTSRFADYKPAWWVLPAFSAAMLVAILVTYLGLQYEQDVIALSGIVFFGLTTCALLVSFVRYAWLLACDLFGRQ